MGIKKKQNLKRTIKYLSQCHNPKVVASIIRDSPKGVIKAVCNAALNAAKGQIVLKRKHKKLLATHRNQIHSLIQTGGSVDQKRKLLVQRGGLLWGFIIPPLLSAVLGSIGTKFLS